MTVFRDSVSARDVAVLAHLHMTTLPQSLIARIGASYARAFYRYVVRSRYEMLCMLRDGSGIVKAALVLSFDPATMERRLLLEPPLLFWATLRPWRLSLNSLVRDLYRGSRAGLWSDDRPELIIIFTDPAYRGQGLGSSLIHLCETALLERNVRSYTVKTEDEQDNRALRFYNRNGFRLSRRIERYGLTFAVFEKHTAPVPNGGSVGQRSRT